jgi:hypothetical protein
MKKVRVFEFFMPDMLNKSGAAEEIAGKKILEKWLKTDEGIFCVRESKTKLETVKDWDDPYYGNRLRIFAEFYEKIETFWRLKFK